MEVYRWRSVISVAVAAGVSMFTVLGLLYITTQRLNSESAATNRRLADTAVSNTLAEMRDWAREYAWWDASLEHLVLKLDPTWADDNIGLYASENLDISLTFVRSGDDTAIIGFAGGEITDAEPSTIVGPDLETLVLEARKSPFDQVTPVAAIAHHEGRAYFLAAAAITPEQVPEDMTLFTPRAVLVFGRAIDDDYLATISDRFNLPDFAFETVLPPDDARDAMPANGISGDTVGYFVWTTAKPGDGLMRILAIPVAIAIAIIAGLSGWTVYLARRAENEAVKVIEQHREQNRLLSKRERELVLHKEALQLANQRKTRFVTNMNHELRTPLNTILGFSEIIRNEQLGPIQNKRYVEYAQDIYNSGSFLLAIVNDILDLSAIEAGKVTLNVENFALKPLIAGCLQTFRTQLSVKDLRVETAIADNLPKLHADYRAVQQIFVNLMTNAVKFTEKGGRITVRVRASAEPGKQEIVVEDTGIGIDPSHLDTITEPFAQVSDSRYHAVPGTGLGLSIVKGLVELLQGSFQIESEVGNGTTVTITLPNAPDIETEPA